MEIAEITEIVEESKDVKTFFVDKRFDAKPGQFAMLWIPGVNEKPMSFSYRNGFTVKKVGEFTKKMHELCEGDKIGIRGPYGSSFSLKNGKIEIIGGGTGLSPLRFLAESIKREVKILLGFKNKKEVFFEEEFKKYGEVLVSTDDGSYGKKGFITEYTDTSFDYYYVCGPEMMMKRCSEILKSKEVEYSLERYMKCGVGLCGSCEVGGYLVCKDGPVFKELPEGFGEYKRDRTGRRIKF
ncbi:MAG TPA: dihydroorotate dehydrogenase electron transfer subunit [Euryarchaeota archaeon]|nr:dihydroorotate dehydrogenase electron transfer subunit [Euryarchaeota archaeon]